ncbi:MAG: DUF3365 domain-containing protein [Candidatus Parabeggiatoa sp. nov. 2]|nr:MAG: hypothetical protein B6247_11925 [Beggiatoa sp. 4572_84]RKZ57454.1 MAG: DUF3365 domain-containing protein [Gammaproteobacteria bacterium]HEC84104.1 DUF3365 domain-containing protein [Thioploca sp.]
MKRFAFSLVLLSFIFGLLSCQTESKDAKMDAKLTSYRNTIKEFVGSLQSELKAAMKKGGPINAISVCHTKAPQIRAQFSHKKAGFEIARTSLKPRNADNAPDEWEKTVLEQFEKRKAQGEDPKTLEFHQVVETNGQRQLRYMKAIPTAEVCLLCHGATIAPDIQAKLKELYPDDKATGFKVGDLRGAFSITETM